MIYLIYAIMAVVYLFKAGGTHDPQQAIYFALIAIFWQLVCIETAILRIKEKNK